MNHNRIEIIVFYSLMIAGCTQSQGPPLAPVSGVVTLDGKPLEDATVVFQPTGKQASPSIAETASDGAFELSFGRDRKGAMIGTHKVKITTEKVVTDESGKETTKPEKVPPNYNRQSTLQLDVVAGNNDFEIELDSKVAPPPAPVNKSNNGCP